MLSFIKIYRHVYSKFLAVNGRAPLNEYIVLKYDNVKQINKHIVFTIVLGKS